MFKKHRKVVLYILWLTQLIQTGWDSAPFQFSACKAPTGQMMIPLEIFSVNVVYKKRIGVIGWKLGLWHQFKNLDILANLAES